MMSWIVISFLNFGIQVLMVVFYFLSEIGDNHVVKTLYLTFPFSHSMRQSHASIRYSICVSGLNSMLLCF